MKLFKKMWNVYANQTFIERFNTHISAALVLALIDVILYFTVLS